MSVLDKVKQNLKACEVRLNGLKKEESLKLCSEFDDLCSTIEGITNFASEEMLKSLNEEDLTDMNVNLIHILNSLNEFEEALK